MKEKLPIDFTLSGIQKSKIKVSVITGSGIDAEAGLPTFRGEKGYYEDKESAYLASIDALKYDPIKQWDWYLRRFAIYKDTPPSFSHKILAKLEKTIGEKFLGIITQNVSGIHKKSGSNKVFEIHGSIREMRSLNNGECRSIPNSWIKSPPGLEELKKWRPNVCFIGERYDEFPISESVEVCRNCDILLVIGTAGVIQTPVWLALQARNSGAVVVNINPNSGELDKVSEYVYRGTALEYFKE